MSWEKTNVGTLREALVDRLNYTEEQAGEIKGKQNLVMCFVDAGLSYEDVFGNDEPDELLDIDLTALEVGEEVKFIPSEEEVEEGEKSIAKKLYGQIGWSEYVMSLFSDNELIDGKPKLNGLRRVTETLLGRIVFSGPIDTKVHFPNDPDEIGRACVTYEIRIECQLDLGEYVNQGDLMSFQYPTRTYRGIGGAWIGNLDEKFANYPEAIAESRAEARAYRKALFLDTVSYEEVSEKSGSDVVAHLREKKGREVTSDYNEDDNMQHSQRKFIEVKSEQLGVDIGKLCGLVVEKDFEKLTRAEAKKVIEELVKYQSNNDESISIPEEVKL